MKKKITYILVINAFFLFIILLLGEALTRITTDSSEYSDKSVIDSNLGWKNKEHYAATYSMTDFGDDSGHHYMVNYSTAEHGCRVWGDTASSKPKVLFIGDSYTQAVEVSDSLTFYHILQDSLDFELFAYGQAGWGTLQEYLWLTSMVPIVKPDLIIWQTCDNDFIDNYAPLEYNSNYKVGLRRPYLTPDGSIIHKVARPAWENTLSYSKFLTLLKNKWQTTSAKFTSRKTTQQLITELADDYEPYKKSKNVTRQIFEKAATQFSEVPIYLFSASAYQPLLSDMDTQLTSVGYSLDSIPILNLRAKKWGGQVINSADGYHFNELGHRLLASELQPRILPLIEKLQNQ